MFALSVPFCQCQLSLVMLLTSQRALHLLALMAAAALVAQWAMGSGAVAGVAIASIMVACGNRIRGS